MSDIKEGSDTNVGSIEKDIKRCEELIKPEHANWIGISNQLAIAHVVDRVKEVENDLTTAYLKGYADAEEKYREKIKGKRDEINKKYEDSKDENGESPYYYPEYTIKVLEELLEEK